MTNHRPYADEGEVQTTFNEIRASLGRIEEQTKATNGRIRALEAWKIDQEAYRRGAARARLTDLAIVGGVGSICGGAIAVFAPIVVGLVSGK